MTTTVLVALLTGVLLLMFGQTGPGVLVLGALVVVGWLYLRARLRYVGGKAVAYHTFGVNSEVVVNHEGGHGWGFEEVGGRVDRIEVGPDWGVTYGKLPRGASIEDDIMVDYAGGYAAGTWAGCSSDLSHARKQLAKLSPAERDAVEARARARARQAGGGLVFKNPTVVSYANHLRKNGEYQS